MDDVAVLLAQGAVADEGGEGEVEDFGEVSDGVCVGVGEAGAFERADDGLRLVYQAACGEDVLFVGADDVRGCCEGVEVGCGVVVGVGQRGGGGGGEV